MENGAVILVSSLVARGSVGLRAMGFAMERLGIEAWMVPTILLPHHPGHGTGTKIVPPRADFDRLMEDLIGRLDGQVAAVVTGYFAGPEQVAIAERLVAAVKAANGDALYLCDPVIADAGRLYVGEELAAEIRDRLLPLADIATPNRFECAWLAGRPDMDGDPAAEAAGLPVQEVLVTSVPALMRGQIGTLLSADGHAMIAEHRLVASDIKGTGDLLAALYLARRLLGESGEAALQMATAATCEIIAASAAAGAGDLLLARFQASLIQPRTPTTIRRLAQLRRSGA